MDETPIDRAKVKAILADIMAQKERAIANANALGGAVDAINAVLAIKPDEPEVSEPPAE